MNMNMNNEKLLLQKQKYYLEKTGHIDVSTRIEQLQILKETIRKYEEDILGALAKDLGKHPFEAYSNEVGFIYSSIDHALKHIKKWAKVKKVRNDVAQLPGKSMVYPAPYGNVLIIGPYN